MYLDVAKSMMLSEKFRAGLSGAQSAVDNRFTGPCALHDLRGLTDLVLIIIFLFFINAAPIISSARFFVLSNIVDCF